MVDSKMSHEDALRLPVVALGAEHLAMAMLMRRNVLAYKAPMNQAGYDLICVHPDPKMSRLLARIQVKSWYATDSNREMPLSKSSLDSFDFLICVFMNIGPFYRKKARATDPTAPTVYTLPQHVVKELHWQPDSGRKGKLKLAPKGLEEYENERGLELVAEFLNVPLPKRGQPGT